LPSGWSVLSNHFWRVGGQGQRAPDLAAAYEREAIRAHALGRFGDMLLAAESHPACCSNLDNAPLDRSDSLAGIRQKRGVNDI